jgi:2-dehydro-3-deoxyphosphogluconate aldolase / (4S)-4-hydroxy-2-oxoglutarate aldolase
MANVLKQLRDSRIVPVIVIDDPDAAVPLARALVEGGLPVAEVTFRTDAGVESLRRITEAYPGMLAGAGTVLTPRQVARAAEAGAAFVVSPGFNPAVVDACLERRIPVYPGVCTPTEIEMALAKGLEVVKFFPAEPIGGLAYLRAIAAPYGMMQFMPTGGITPALLGDYLRFPRVVACGGSWMVAPEWVRNQDFDRVRREVERAVASVRDITGGT